MGKGRRWAGGWQRAADGGNCGQEKGGGGKLGGSLPPREELRVAFGADNHARESAVPACLVLDLINAFAFLGSYGQVIALLGFDGLQGFDHFFKGQGGCVHVQAR